VAGSSGGSSAVGSPAPVSPRQVAEVKAIAGEPPATHGLPLSRCTRAELHRLIIERGITDASATTIRRWLNDEAIKPRQQRAWIVMRDPALPGKAGRLHPDEDVICADEKSQPQALGRRHETVLAGPGRPTPVEFDYRRGGTLAHPAARDVHHAKPFDRVEAPPGSNRSPGWSIMS